MPLNEEQVYGNLASYKFHVRPVAHELYGSVPDPTTKHKQNVHNLMTILFNCGKCTTWEIAKTIFHKNITSVREHEKIYRRLLIGRIDRDRYSDGLMQTGMVVKDKTDYTKPYARYRLSLYGILYYLDVFDPSNKDIDNMTANYDKVLPMIFGKWKFLKSHLGTDVYNLRILAKGLLLDNQMATDDDDNPLYELMMFVNTKYKNNFESITEEHLAEQISFWFYTFLLYPRKQKHEKNRQELLKMLLDGDAELRAWYGNFVNEARHYYKKRLAVMQNTIL